jgi:LmbE family N-acetylglucosaminyl deacetylase
MSYDVVYLSPHPDDAVFSAGGAIALDVRAGLRVGVATIFSRTGDGTHIERAEEDRRAIRYLYSSRIDLGFDDAPVRSERYRKPGFLLGPLGDGEAALVEKVRAAIQSLGAPRIVAPLGVGEHVDHQVVYTAATQLDGDVAFYEDVPYALEPFAVARRLWRIGTGGPPRAGFLRELPSLVRWWSELPMVADDYSAITRPVAGLALAMPSFPVRRPRGSSVPSFSEHRIDVRKTFGLKLTAMAAYKSQWPLFQRSFDDWRCALRDLSSRIDGSTLVERQWRMSRA